MTSRRSFIKKIGVIAAAAAITPNLAFAGKKPSRKGEYDLKGQHVKLDSSWDVIVVGGGPGGCTAAIAAAREGARTLLIEANGILGGMGTAGMVPAWTPFSDGEKMIYRGLAEKIFNASFKGVPHEPKGKLDWVNINPEHLIRVYDDMVTASGAQILFFSRVAAVEKSADDTLEAIIVANKNGLTAFKAKVFVDATGDGDLCAWAGAECMKGDEYGTVQQSSLCFEIANINTNAWLAGPNLHSDNPHSPLHRLMASGRYPLLARHLCLNLVGPDVLGFNAGHIDVDSTNPWAVTESMILGRKIAVEYHNALKEMAPDVFKDSFIVRTASALGVRESRRVVGDYILTADDWNARRTFDDEIGRNCYYLDVHKPGFVPVYYGKGDSHGVPYRCLTPKDLKNVLVAGRCISTDSQVFGSVRVMPCCLMNGEAAGMAAAHAIKQCSSNVHNVDVDYLRKRLKEEGQYFL